MKLGKSMSVSSWNWLSIESDLGFNCVGSGTDSHWILNLLDLFCLIKIIWNLDCW